MEISVYNKNIDFYRKREEKESKLKEALSNLEEFKKRTPESVYPQDIYGSVMNPKILYASEYTRLLETAVRAKTTLEIMDLVLEGLMRERISILEDILKS